MEELASALQRLAAADLAHPSIVQRVAAGVEGQTVYLAEEYVAAESLDIALRHYAPAPLDTALPFIRQLGGAIDAAAARGVRHGTLHPRDIFLTPDLARATGFGLAEALEHVGVRPPVRRPYSAPERVAGAPWGTRADIYTLAAVAHELLTGRRVAGTGDVAAIAAPAARSNPEGLRAALAIGLAEDPGARFASGLAFADALEAAALGDSPAEIQREHVIVPVEDLEFGEAAADEAVYHLERGETLGDLPLRDEEFEAEDRPVGEEPGEAIEDEDEPTADEVDLAAGEPAFDESGDWEPEGRDRHPWLFERDVPGVPVGQEADIERAEVGAGDAGAEDLAEEVAEEAAEEPVADEPYDRRDEEDDLESDLEPVHEAAPSDDWEEDAALGHRPAGRSRPGMSPLALMVAVGMLVGFLAGYLVGSRERGVAPPDQPAATAQPAPGGDTQWSEAAVEAPARPLTPPPGPPAAAPPEAIAEPAAAPGSQPGRLVVRSTPSGAAVTVDGEDRGVTPVTLDDVAFGPHTVEVRREGYEAQSRGLALTSALPTRELVFQLERTRPAPPARATPSTQPAAGSAAPRAGPPSSARATLFADTRPTGARVLLDGRIVGKTPLRLTDLPAGVHRVRFELDGYRPWTTAVTLEGGRETRVTGSLERMQSP